MNRINYFRAMAGVGDDITFDSTYNTKAQAAALMMSANQALSHSPPADWDCFSSTVTRGRAIRTSPLECSGRRR